MPVCHDPLCSKQIGLTRRPCSPQTGQMMRAWRRYCFPRRRSTCLSAGPTRPVGTRRAARWATQRGVGEGAMAVRVEVARAVVVMEGVVQVEAKVAVIPAAAREVAVGAAKMVGVVSAAELKAVAGEAAEAPVAGSTAVEKEGGGMAVVTRVAAK
eukprot:5802188-Prymnesium_polylepis.1